MLYNLCEKDKGQFFPYMFDARRDGLMMVSFFDSAVKDYLGFILPVDDYKDPNTRCVSWPRKDSKQWRNGNKNFHDNQC